MPRKSKTDATGAKDSAPLTHDRIAKHMADFAQKGGRVEVLSNTPLRKGKQGDK